MSEPNLAQAQALVMAWRFPLPLYSPRRTCSHTRRVLLPLILAASYSLSFSPPAASLTSYLLRCMVQLPAVCHSESCANHVTKLAIILVASYSPLYSLRLTCTHTRRVLLAVSDSLSFSPPAPSLTSYLSRCIVQLPAVCHSESCTNHVTKLAIILTASYLLSSSPPASSSPSSS